MDVVRLGGAPVVAGLVEEVDGDDHGERKVDPSTRHNGADLRRSCSQVPCMAFLCRCMPVVQFRSTQLLGI